MSDPDVNELARLLQPRTETVDWGRGVIVSVDNTAKTAVVLVDGGDLVIPFYSHLTLTAGNNVDILYAGSATRILGVVA